LSKRKFCICNAFRYFRDPSALLCVAFRVQRELTVCFGLFSPHGERQGVFGVCRAFKRSVGGFKKIGRIRIRRFRRIRCFFGIRGFRLLGGLRAFGCGCRFGALCGLSRTFRRARFKKAWGGLRFRLGSSAARKGENGTEYGGGYDEKQKFFHIYIIISFQKNHGKKFTVHQNFCRSAFFLCMEILIIF